MILERLRTIYMNYKIRMLCKKYFIHNYTIKDGLVNVDGNVCLYNSGLTKLPLKFGEVSGNFDCAQNRLTSLEGCPTYVGDNFYCTDNRLTSLEGCPDEVVGKFYCRDNEIYTLDGLFFKRIKIVSMYNNPIEYLYNKYNLDDIDHREFLIEADVIRPPNEIGGKPIINKVRMDWFIQTYGLKEFNGDRNYSIEY